MAQRTAVRLHHWRPMPLTIVGRRYGVPKSALDLWLVSFPKHRRRRTEEIPPHERQGKVRE